MNRTVRIIAIVLLIFLGISALGGGIGLMLDPSGEELGMPLRFLDHTPFSSFLIPGIILFVMNGLLSILIAVIVMRKSAISAWLVLLQGFIVLGWILVQLAMIREYDALLHTLYLGVGAALVVTGFLMRNLVPQRGRDLIILL